MSNDRTPEELWEAFDDGDTGDVTAEDVNRAAVSKAAAVWGGADSERLRGIIERSSVGDLTLRHMRAMRFVDAVLALANEWSQGRELDTAYGRPAEESAAEEIRRLATKHGVIDQ